ncbi:MAG: tetratricopeptide repeat protein [candidate division KSB1 bacterium]|nr:tetratricopeptide repeat protein [candidate division KSB1 bacterium]MDZ7366576.1 tetratricopeptide repeat protein [candidate division KSB1 bacterium]MDZ7406707.1 tetratricopeptide repeat protein [candidate division KSB1 bacterium]
MSQCAKCGTELPKSAKFCPNCGEKVGAVASNFCRECGVELKPHAQFCHACGISVDGTYLSDKTSEYEIDDAQTPAAPPARSWLAILLPLIGIPVLIAILFLLTHKQKNPAPMNQAQTAGAAGRAEDGQGMDMAAMEQVTKQIEKYKNDLKTNPKDTTALLALGSMYEIAGRFEEAADYFRRYLEVAPENIPVRMSLAGIYYNDAKRQQALNELQQVLKHRPNYDYAMFNLAVIYLAEGKKDEAIKWWHKVMEADPSGELAHKAREQIQAAAGK